MSLGPFTIEEAELFASTCELLYPYFDFSGRPQIREVLGGYAVEIVIFRKTIAYSIKGIGDARHPFRELNNGRRAEEYNKKAEKLLRPVTTLVAYKLAAAGAKDEDIVGAVIDWFCTDNFSEYVEEFVLDLREEIENFPHQWNHPEDFEMGGYFE